MENGQATKEEERETKRLKPTEETFNLQDWIVPEVLDNVEQVRDEYKSSKPYNHAALPKVFRPDFIDAAIHEIQHNSKVNFKESDLFRVYQSMDLANLTKEEHAEAMPNVWKLRNVLYSKEWRNYIERVCGLPEGTLIEKVDCACNCHIEGCHLLCHDDVIGTRKVSYIIYMTDADWKAEEGGALELYDRVKSADGDEFVPETIPSTNILPTRNSMAFFVVEPGVSFHAVQEVFGSRPRLSLQGWYHAVDPPSKIESATLHRLKNRESHDTAATRFQPFPSPTVAAAASASDRVTLTEADKTYLSNFIQEVYLKPESIKDIRNRFEEDSSVQLREFLVSDWIEKIWSSAASEDERDYKNINDPEYYSQGLRDGWLMTGPAHKQRFLEYKRQEEDPCSTGGLMNRLKTDLLQSPAFRRYLAILTQLGEPTGFSGRIRRFRRGLDYTVAHHGLLMENAVLDATLCFVAGRGKDVQTEMEQDESQIHEADVQWQSGDVGGFECYIAADDDDGPSDAPDEYNEDDDTELLSVSASNNTLSLVYRDQGTMRFVKYVGSKAPSSRYDIAMVYEVAQDEEGDVAGSGDDPDITGPTQE
jgi:Rps23 Pro-64 3,4-dihydroxylase Tpa1-like proline 4-hydroxylase